MSPYIPLTTVDLALAAIFLVLNALFSILLQLRLERQLIVSALRLVIQLLLVGLVLKTIFTLASPWLTLLAASIAGREIRARQDRRLSHRGAGFIGESLLDKLVVGKHRAVEKQDVDAINTFQHIRRRYFNERPERSH